MVKSGMEPEFDELPEYTDLETVFYGTLNEATVLRSALQAHGYAAFIPYENIKTTDPFVTGANALSVTVVVPVGIADEVRAVMDEMREMSEVTPEDEERASRGSRQRWLFLILLVFVLPTALIFLFNWLF